MECGIFFEHWKEGDIYRKGDISDILVVLVTSASNTYVM